MVFLFLTWCTTRSYASTPLSSDIFIFVRVLCSRSNVHSTARSHRFNMELVVPQPHSGCATWFLPQYTAQFAVYSILTNSFSHHGHCAYSGPAFLTFKLDKPGDNQTLFITLPDIFFPQRLIDYNGGRNRSSRM